MLPRTKFLNKKFCHEPKFLSHRRFKIYEPISFFGKLNSCRAFIWRHENGKEAFSLLQIWVAWVRLKTERYLNSVCSGIRIHNFWTLFSKSVYSNITSCFWNFVQFLICFGIESIWAIFMFFGVWKFNLLGIWVIIRLETYIGNIVDWKH